MEEKFKALSKKFNTRGEFAGFKTFTSGHINTTALIKTEDGVGRKFYYILQKINKNVFKEPAEVMDNIIATTSFIKNKLTQNGTDPYRKVLEFLPAENGEFFTVDENGDYWRMYNFVSNSTTFDATSDLAVLEETGKAFGEFQHLLEGFDAQNLNIIIPHFHNTPNRYKLFREQIKANKTNRVFPCVAEIEGFLALEQFAIKMYGMQKEGALPLRVTHNDTKCNNVLFDNLTGEYLCVIDLDTIMPGLVGFDFGDAVRFAANTAAEDEQDTTKVKLDLEKFRAIAKGFLKTAGNSLTKNEKETLSLGAITMTTECGVRFLTDYLDGDNYFHTDYPAHNLVRARTQLALAEDMLAHYKEMQDIIHECLAENENEQ